MRIPLLFLVAALAGCATTKTPTATNLVDSSPLVVSVKRSFGALRDTELTVTDPKTGETFTGRIPGTKQAIVMTLGGGRTSHFSGMADGHPFSGTIREPAPVPPSQPLPNESIGVLQGDKGGTLVCKFNPGAGTGLCVTPGAGYVYVDF
jgi:hypothetical protein